MSASSTKTSSSSIPRPVRSGGGFRNPRRHEDRTWLDVLRWKLAASGARWPSRVSLAQADAPAAPIQGLTATWIGHASFLIRSPAKAWLIDPVWSGRVGPFGLLGPRRVQSPALDFATLPRIDGVWLSHDHYDHCDLPTLRRIAREHPEARLFTPLGHRDLARRAGFGSSRHQALDWWEKTELAPGFSLTSTPARHWGNRLSGRRNQRLWGGWHLAAPEVSLFFSGDTAFDAEMFAAVRQVLGAPDLALLPIGAYAPRWFMREQHCDPEEAVRIFKTLGARRALGMHWGAFPLTDEPREEPPARLANAAREAGLPPDAFTALDPGVTLYAAR